jgi:hypothetical protein
MRGVVVAEWSQGRRGFAARRASLSPRSDNNPAGVEAENKRECNKAKQRVMIDDRAEHDACDGKSRRPSFARVILDRKSLDFD